MFSLNKIMCVFLIDMRYLEGTLLKSSVFLVVNEWKKLGKLFAKDNSQHEKHRLHINWPFINRHYYSQCFSLTGSVSYVPDSFFFQYMMLRKFCFEGFSLFSIFFIQFFCCCYSSALHCFELAAHECPFSLFKWRYRKRNSEAIKDAKE